MQLPVLHTLLQYLTYFQEIVSGTHNRELSVIYQNVDVCSVLCGGRLYEYFMKFLRQLIFMSISCTSRNDLRLTVPSSDRQGVRTTLGSLFRFMSLGTALVTLSRWFVKIRLFFILAASVIAMQTITKNK